MNNSEYKPYPQDYPILDELITYSNDCIQGRIIACQKHKWACLRFLKDIERENTADFPYYFDEQKAIRFLNWMKLFKHRKGPLRGQRIDPHIIQKFVFGNIYGWNHTETHFRRFDKAYWQVARKNAKSQSLGTVGSYELSAFGEGSSEVYCAATKKEQAKIVWDETKAMLDQCKELKGKFDVSYGTIWHKGSGSFMKALSKEDKKSGDGFNPQCGIVDEYHAHKDAEMYDVIETGIIAREQPIIVIITTAGYELNNPCYRIEYDLASKILNPEMPIDAENVFAMINELDKNDDIKNEENWHKANPIAASYKVGLDAIRKKMKLALIQPEKMRTFLTKNMNVWIEYRESGYMDMAKWNSCSIESIPKELDDCYAGIDLSSKIDLTSVTFVFPMKNEEFFVYSHSFMPENKYEERLSKDIVPYDLWVKNGWLTLTPGDVVDYNFVEKYIIDTAKEKGWTVQEIAFDPYNATQFANNMMDLGYECVEIRQGHRTLAEPTKGFRDAVYAAKLKHLNDPVLAWAMGNAVTKADVNDNIMLDKKMSRQRIDPAAAAINGFTRAMHKKISLPEITDDYLDDLGW